jgi:hypothetical protein
MACSARPCLSAVRALQGAVDDEGVVPEIVQQFLFGNDAVPVHHEVAQQVEYQRLHLDLPPVEAEFAGILVESVMAEPVAHGDWAGERCRPAYPQMIRV